MAEAGQGQGRVAELVRSVPAFVNQVKAETDKVAWPTRRETAMTAVMVVVMTLVLGIFFFTVDWGFSRIVRVLLKLA